MKIDGISIGSEYEPYVIAEVSANHNGNIETAKELINVAKIAGASAVKLQTYTPDTITLNSDSEDFKIKDISPYSNRTFNSLDKLDIIFFTNRTSLSECKTLFSFLQIPLFIKDDTNKNELIS